MVDTKWSPSTPKNLQQVGRVVRDPTTMQIHIEFEDSTAYYQFKAGSYTADFKRLVMGKFRKAFSTYWERHESIWCGGPVIPCFDHEMKHGMVTNTRVMLPINIKYDDLIALSTRGLTTVTIEEM